MDYSKPKTIIAFLITHKMHDLNILPDTVCDPLKELSGCLLPGLKPLLLCGTAEFRVEGKQFAYDTSVPEFLVRWALFVPGIHLTMY